MSSASSAANTRDRSQTRRSRSCGRISRPTHCANATRSVSSLPSGYMSAERMFSFRDDEILLPSSNRVSLLCPICAAECAAGRNRQHPKLRYIVMRSRRTICIMSVTTLHRTGVVAGPTVWASALGDRYRETTSYGRRVLLKRFPISLHRTRRWRSSWHTPVAGRARGRDRWRPVGRGSCARRPCSGAF